MAWRKAVSGVAVRKSVKSHSCKGFMTVLENGFHAVKSHNIMGQREYLKALNAVDFGFQVLLVYFFARPHFEAIFFGIVPPPPLKSHQPASPPDLNNKKKERSPLEVNRTIGVRLGSISYAGNEAKNLPA